MYTAQGRIKQNELLTQYMPLVRRQALTLQVRLPASIELDDLIQAGMVGLLGTGCPAACAVRRAQWTVPFAS